MNRSIYIGTALLASGLTIGYLIGHHSARARVAEMAVNPATRSLPSASIAEKNVITILDQQPVSTLDSLMIYHTREFNRLSSAALAKEAYKLKEAPFELQSMMTPALFSAWAQHDPRNALLSATNLAHMKNEMIALTLAQWVETDPISAATFYKAHEGTLFTQNYQAPWDQVSGSAVIAKAIRATASLDEALKWSRKLGDIGDKNYAVATLIREEALQSPSEAETLLNELDGAERDHALKALAEVWAEQSGAAAIEWANRLESRDRENILPNLIKGIAKNDPATAASLLNYIPGNHDNAIRSIITPWVNTNPAAAANWLISSTTVDQQSYFVQPILQKWIESDPQAARDWTVNLEPGDSKDESVIAYINTIASGTEDPSPLLSMAQKTISNNEKLEQAEVNVLVSWSRIAPDRAQQMAREMKWSNEALANFLHETNAEEPIQ